MTINKGVSGTKEWVAINFNIYKGCEHDCRYCYARWNALRFKRITNAEYWHVPVLNMAALKRPWRLKKGTVMFPSTHDITPSTLDSCLIALKNVLKPGNRVLIVSKPHLECIQTICEELVEYRDNILFRFTIGSLLNDMLKFWEPGAPCFEERLMCLRVAYGQGFDTSVSCEPYLDASITEGIRLVTPYVTDTIWIGKMNKIEQRVDMRGWRDLEFGFLKSVERAQTDLAVARLADALKDNPKIKWKESCKKVLGIPLATKAGQDE